MGDYNVYRIYAKIDRAYGERMLERLNRWNQSDHISVGRPCEMDPSLPVWWGLIDNMRMCYHDIYFDNHGYKNPDNTEVTPFDKQITLHDDHAILDVFFSYKVGYSFEAQFQDLANHLVLKEGQSVVFAMVQSEYVFGGRIDVWVASRGSETTNITTESIRGDVCEEGFHPAVLQPFATQWLNPSYTVQFETGQRKLQGSENIFERIAVSQENLQLDGRSSN